MDSTPELDSTIYKIPSQFYLSLPNGKTFWDEGQYEAVVKRLENGKRSLNDFLLMVEERSVIERRYADKLQSWYKKWSVTVRQGPEFGDIQTVWQSILNEGRKIADIHFNMSHKLGLSHSEGVQKTAYAFKKAHYHRLPLQKDIREVRDCKETFRTIQAPYKKAIENILKCKKKYMEASRSCLQAIQKEGVSSAKLDSLTEAKEKCKSKYLDAIHSFNDSVRDKYTKEMNKEFQSKQNIELERLKVLLNSLHDFIGIVDQQSHTVAPLSNIYREAMAPLNTVTPEKHVLHFSRKFGTEMAQNFPKFEDTDSEIIKAQLLTEPASLVPKLPAQLLDFKNKNVFITRLRHLKQLSSDGHMRSSGRSSTKDFLMRRLSNTDEYGNSTHSVEFSDVNQNFGKRSLDAAMLQVDSLKELSTEDLAPNIGSSDHYKLNNVYVRVISPFTSDDKGHLTINKGDVIYQLKGDSKGWCYGRIAYKEGLYPSNAVRLLTLDILT